MSVYCSKCGQQCQGDDVFCRKCGSPIGAAPGVSAADIRAELDATPEIDEIRDLSRASADELTLKALAWKDRKAGVKTRHRGDWGGGSSEWYGIHKLVSFFIPIVGLAFFVVFMADRNASRLRRSAGVSCLFWACFGSILGTLAWMMMVHGALHQ